MHLFVRDDDVGVIDAPQAMVGDRQQAMVGDRQQAIGVGRQVDADHARALVGNHVQEAGILVRKAVVVLAPD